MAVATRTHPMEWLNTPDPIIATMLEVLEETHRRR